MPRTGGFGQVPRCNKTLAFLDRGKSHDLRLYPHLPRRRRRPGQSAPEAQVQALAGAGVEPANIVSDVGISGAVPAGDRPGWSSLDARLRRGDTVTVAALDRISRNRVELVAAVESLHRRGVGIASLAPSESWLHPLGAHPTDGPVSPFEAVHWASARTTSSLLRWLTLLFLVSPIRLKAVPQH